MYFGTHEISKVYVNGHEGKKLYLGDLLVWMKGHSVSCTFDGVTSNAPSVVPAGDGLSVTLTPASGKQILPWTVVVTMGGTDITSTAYTAATNTISIAEVTGSVNITASAVTMDAAYAPVEYISVASKASGNVLKTDYLPNNNTKLYMDVEITSTTTNQMLFAIKNPNTAPSATECQFYQWVRIAATTINFAWGSAIRGTSGASKRLFKIGQRVPYTCDKGKFSYVIEDGSTYTYTLNGGTWQAVHNNDKDERFKIFGNSSSYCCIGKIYRVTISEPTENDENVLHDFIPCKRLSDGHAGLYDIKNETYLHASVYTYPS